MSLTTLKAICIILAIVLVNVLGFLLDRYKVGDLATVIVFIIVVLVPFAFYYFFGGAFFERLFILQKAHDRNIIVDDRFDDETKDETISLNLNAHGRDIVEKTRDENEFEGEDKMILLNLTDGT